RPSANVSSLAGVRSFLGQDRTAAPAILYVGQERCPLSRTAIRSPQRIAFGGDKAFANLVGRAKCHGKSNPHRVCPTTEHRPLSAMGEGAAHRTRSDGFSCGCSPRRRVAESRQNYGAEQER